MKTFKILIRDIFRFRINLNRINYAFLFLSFNLFGQDVSEEKPRGPRAEITELSCQVKFETEFNSLTMKEDFKLEFEQEFQIDFFTFEELNPFDLSLIKKKLSIEYCSRKKPDFDAKKLLFKYISEFNENFLFDRPVEIDPKFTKLGKYVSKPHHEDDEMWVKPKTLMCLNAGFEDQNFNSWQTFCANVDSNLVQTINVIPYTPPSNCPAPVGGITQHSIVTGGIDPFTGFQRVFPNGGGASAMLGDGTNVNFRSSVIRKTFVVDPTKTLLRYSYMAVLENPVNHLPGEQPFFRARLYDQNGVSDTCAYYNSYGGDGAPGWIVNGNMQYRDWTTILIPLNNYIGQTVTLELATGDCGLGAHFGYAYVDVTCDNLEIEQICQGVSTVLVAPPGAGAYLWNTGETSEQITITTPGLYVCTITPVGSICSVDIPITATIFPIPIVNFIPSDLEMCVGGEVEFVDNTNLSSGAIISSYVWDFGDGISTPAGLGTINGVAQTSGTYTLAQHIFNTVGNPNINLTVVTTDGCTVSDGKPIGILTLPTAIIEGSDSLCLNENSPFVAFTGANGVSPYLFTYNVNGGVNQTILSVGNSALLPVPTDSVGVFTYNLLYVEDVTTQCGQVQLGTATVVISPLPTAQISGDAVVCHDDVEPIVTFTAISGCTNCSFEYNINGGATQTVSSIGSNSATLSVPTGVVGTFNYNLLGITNLETSCSQPQNQTVTIVINPIPSATISGSTVVCQDATEPQVTFTGINASPDYTFTFTINSGLNQFFTQNVAQIVTTSGTNSVSVNVPTSVAGVFIYELTNVNALCSQDLFLTDTIVVNPLPQAQISLPIEICLNDSTDYYMVFGGSQGYSPYTFTYTINGGSPQQISTDPGVDTVAILLQTYVPGIFTYAIINIQSGGPLACEQTQEIASCVHIHDLPVVFAGNDMPVCEDEPIILQATGAGIGGTYVWDYGVINGVPFLPSDTVVYSVIGTDINGCKDTDQVVVDLVPFPIMDFEGVNLSGCAPLVATFTNLSSGNLVDCQWNFGTGIVLNACDSVTMIFTESGFYDVSLNVSTPEGCANSLTLDSYVNVYANPNASFSFTPDVLYNYDWEANITNHSTGAVSYVWDFGDGTANSTQVNPVHAYPNEMGGFYVIELTATSSQGCVDIAQQTIQLIEESLFYVPNTFTPDGDQHNGVFKPVYAPGFNPAGYKLLIFNRWGEVVFESREIDYGWNGDYKGMVSQDGTYTWKITFNTSATSKIKEFVGHVNLIK